MVRFSETAIDRFVDGTMLLGYLWELIAGFIGVMGFCMGHADYVKGDYEVCI